MEKKKEKKKLTLSVSSKKLHNVPKYAPSRGKTSVVIEKKQREDGMRKNSHREKILINRKLLTI